MRKALKRAAHVLVAAGAFGLARPAVAQTSAADARTSVPKTTFAALGKSSTQGASVNAESVSTSLSKLEEIQIELALLSNPGTFAYPLGARHTGGNLELRGFVPNHLIKDKALEIARKNCSVPVVDKLQLHSTLTLRSPAGTVEELRQGAMTLLTESFGETVGDLEIKVADQGRIIVAGSCESYEQKMALSKKLRALNGCCSVDNHLTVKSVLRDGRLVTLITADGSYTLPHSGGSSIPIHTVHNVESVPPLPPAVVPPPVIASTPPPARTELPPKKPEPLPPLASVPSDTLPPPVVTPKTEMPGALVTKPTEMPGAVVTKPTAPPLPAPPPLPPLKPATTPAVAMKPDLPPLPPVKPLPSPVATPLAPTTSPPSVVKADLPPAKPLPAPVAAPLAPLTSPPVAVKTDLPPTISPPQTVKTDLPPAKLLPAPVAAPLAPPTSPPVVVKTDLPPAKPLPAPVAAPLAPTVSPLATVPAYSKEPIQNTNWQTKPTETVVAATTPTPVKSNPPPSVWPAAHEARPVQTPYATSGVVIFEDSLPEPPPLLGKDKVALLKQKIAAVCGSKAKEVVVEMKPDGGMLVHVKTIMQSENEALTNQILMMPEMASPNVKLDVQLAR